MKSVFLLWRKSSKGQFLKTCFVVHLCFFLSMIDIIPLQAQQTIAVRGKVVDQSGLEIIGASVVEKGTTNGITTDANGEFTLNVQAGKTLVISYVGYITKELPAAARLNVVLEDDTKTLEEVVVIGYGTLEKKAVTSSITSISAEKLPVGVGGSTMLNSLLGKVSGLVIYNTGSPNAGASIQLRGISSINAGKSPLVVIDGVPGGDLRSLIQEDILSIDILKDASAGAIYGTRAANGVLLITTKAAKDNANGKYSISYTAEGTYNQAFAKPKMMTAKEYLSHERGTDYGADVDWWNESLADNPYTMKHTVNIQGGNKYSQTYATLQYLKDQGVVKGDDRTDYSGRVNMDFHLLEGWLDVKTNVNYRQASRHNDNKPNMQQALRNNPTRSPYDPESKTGYNVWLNETLDYNSIADWALRDQEGLDKWFIPAVTAKLNILAIPGLALQQSTSYDYRQWENHIYESRYRRSEVENSRTGYAKLEFSKTEFINSEGYVSYINTLKDKHTINAVAGYSYQERNSEKFNMANRNFTNDKVKYWNMGEGQNLKRGEAEMESAKDITERLFALFARANYSYDNKYMLTATVRREGSSKFAANNRWGLFWSLSGGWRISQESFMKNIKWVNDLKLRAGYGVTGNNDFSSTYSATRYGSDVYWLLPNGNWAYTYGKSANVNPELGWEETHDMNLGLDFSLFNNRIYGKVDVYRRKTQGLIYEVQVPQPPYVEQKMHMNIGNMESKGWEVEIGGDVVRSKDWNYTTSINFSHNETKILTLWGNQTYYDYVGLPSPGDPGYAIRIEEGVKIGSFHMWKYAGVDKDGNFLLYNKAGEVIPYSKKKTEDKQYIGNYTPELMVGWNHNLRYKNWDLGLTLTSWIGFDVYNTVDMYLGLPYAQPLSLNVLANAYEKNGEIKGEKQLCDYFLEDGTFLKIQNINLGYTLNLKKYTKFVERARCYLTVDNVARFTKYSGVNPEVQITGIEGGIEKFWDLYPQTRRYALGVQLTF